MAQSKDDLSKVHVADFLPTTTPTQDFTLEVMQEIPAAKQYKFVKLEKRVLIVDAANLDGGGRDHPIGANARISSRQGRCPQGSGRCFVVSKTAAERQKPIA